MSGHTKFVTAQFGFSKSRPSSQTTESYHSNPELRTQALEPLVLRASINLCVARFQGSIVKLSPPILNFSLLSGLILRSLNITVSCGLFARLILDECLQIPQFSFYKHQESNRFIAI